MFGKELGKLVLPQANVGYQYYLWSRSSGYVFQSNCSQTKPSNYVEDGRYHHASLKYFGAPFETSWYNFFLVLFGRTSVCAFLLGAKLNCQIFWVGWQIKMPNSKFRNVYVKNSHFVGEVIVYTLPFILYKAVL